MAQLHDLTALEAAAAVRSREVSPVELVEHALDRIARLDDRLGAFVTVTADAARKQAKEAEAAVAGGRRSRDVAAVARRADGDQGSEPDEGRPDQARLGELCRLRAADRRLRRRAAARGRHDQPRQDGHAGVRSAVLHRDRHRSADPHAVGHVPAGRRLERRRRGRRRRRLAPDRARQRRRWLDSHPRERVRPGRAEAVARPGVPRAARPRIRASRRVRSVSPARCAMPPRFWTRSRFRSRAIRIVRRTCPKARPSSAGAIAIRATCASGGSSSRRFRLTSIPQVRQAWERTSELLASLGHEVTDIPRRVPDGGGPVLRDGVVGVGGARCRSIRPGNICSDR